MQAERQGRRVDTDAAQHPNDWFMWVMVLPAVAARHARWGGRTISRPPRPPSRRPLRPAHIHSACCSALLLVTRPATVSLAPSAGPSLCCACAGCRSPGRPERSHSMHAPDLLAILSMSLDRSVSLSLLCVRVQALPRDQLPTGRRHRTASCSKAQVLARSLRRSIRAAPRPAGQPG